MGLQAPRPFKPSEVLKRDPNRAAFASKQFAANRAGFLLREYARQIITPPPVTNDPELAEITPAGVGLEEATAQMTVNEAAAIDLIGLQHQTLAALNEPVAEFSAQLVTQQVQTAYQEGRSTALHEMQGAIDQAMIALTAAADALAKRYDELEKQLVIPVAKSGVELASLLARQHLATPEHLHAYLDQVLSNLNANDGNESISVRMSPTDYALLSKSLPAGSSLKLIEDSQVSAGGVLVSGGDQVVDDRFERRLREVQEAALAVAADVLRDQAL